ncbi:MAG: sugar ABC transporter substrate-binding protein [Spirochaetaceae bacterium]|nr:MAG: sugar ABC transporter substrate-binding protein [Spirochaetaceae bacterium]
MRYGRWPDDSGQRTNQRDYASKEDEDMRTSMKVTVLVVVVLSVLAAQMAFGRGQTEPVDVEVVDEVLIAGIPTYLDRFDSFLLYSRGMEDRLEALGVPYRYVLRAPSGGFSDHTGQRAIFEDMLVIGSNIIMTLPTSIEVQHAAFEMIVDEYETPLVITDYLEFAEGARPLGNEDLVRFASYRHSDMGKAVADYVAQNYPAGTRMAMIHGIPGVITSERAAEELHLANGMEIIYRHFANFDREMAYRATQDLLVARPDVEVILGMNSTMAIGVVRAVEEADMLDQVDVIGFGGVVEELASVAQGKMKATAGRNHFIIGEYMADLVVAYREGRWEETEKTFAAPITIYDSKESIVRDLDERYYPMLGDEVLGLLGLK